MLKKDSLNPSIDQFPIKSPEQQIRAREVAAIALQAAQLTQDFADIERVPRLANGERENDVEHSYMLAIAAPEIAQKLRLDINQDKVRRFAIVHDLLEVKVGDVATFDLTPAQLEEKERREQVAKIELLQELPEITAQDLDEYERQDTSEAVFVRMVDKLLPIAVDTTGDGVRVIREDYGVHSIKELVDAHNRLHARISEKFSADFPDLVAAHSLLCSYFEDKYLKNASERPKNQEMSRGPIETERKFLISIDTLQQSVNLESMQRSHLRQGYLAIGSDGSETRIRNFDDKHFELTVKSPGMIQRREQTITITSEMFASLWGQTQGQRIEKTRFFIPYGEHSIDLDVYASHLNGLITAEVEFHGRQADASLKATTFEPPVWFGEEISEDPRYKNHSLAKRFPHEPMTLGAKHY